MKMNDVVLDLRTANIQRGVMAYTLITDLPRSTVVGLRGQARAVRLFAEMGEPALVRSALAVLLVALDEMEDNSEVVERLTRRVDDLLGHLGRGRQ